MTSADEWCDAVGDARVRLNYASSDLGDHSEGRLLSYSIGPMVLIETDSGERIWWRASLSEIVDAQAYNRDRPLADWEREILAANRDRAAAPAPPRASHPEGERAPGLRCAGDERAQDPLHPRPRVHPGQRVFGGAEGETMQDVF